MRIRNMKLFYLHDSGIEQVKDDMKLEEIKEN